MKRILLALIAIFLIVIGAILYDVRTAMAASPYDNIVSDYQIETLDMINTNTQSSRNYSQDWYTEGLQALQIRCDSYGGQWCIDYQNYKDWLTDDNGSSTVIKITDTEYQVQFTTDPNATLEFGEGYLYIQAKNIKTATFTYHPNIGASTENGTSIQSTIKNYGEAFAYGTRYLFLSTTPVNYPAGYEGLEIQDSYKPYDEIVIDYAWSITPTEPGDNNKQGKIIFGYNQSKNNINIDCQGEYYLKKMAYNWQEPKEYEISEINGPIQTYKQTFDLTGAGYYTIYLDPEPSCDILIPKTNISSKVMDIYWDGNTIRQGTSLLCDIGSPENCNNIQPGDESLLQQLVDNINLELHGFEKILTAPLTFLAAAESTTCQPLRLPFPHLGNITAPCMTPIYKQYFDPWFTAFQTIVTGVFMYAISINFISTFKNIRNPQDDKIEVAKL